MKPRTIVFGFLFLILLILTGVNWELFSQPAQLNLIAVRVSAPLGLGMLGVVALLTVLYLLVLARVETQAMLDARKCRKELDRYRSLAEAAESSRITELEKQIAVEFSRIRDQIGGSRQATDGV